MFFINGLLKLKKYIEMKNYDEMLAERNIEIFELEEKVKNLSKYQALYFMKMKELNRLKKLIEDNIELLPDQVKYNFRNILEEISGIKYN